MNSLVSMGADNTTLINPNPILRDTSTKPSLTPKIQNDTKAPPTEDELQEWFIFDLIRHIRDPEHPHTLEQLSVVQEHLVKIDSNGRVPHIHVEFTPTVPHCTLATLIGLCIRTKLLRELPYRFKLDITVTKGSHQTEEQVNRQINDKERVQSALENPQLLGLVENCIKESTY
eukprot:TRINITY_DN3815_c0_g1_i3.p2 TRINITY_DN3815_c0_g1~~TRINITY_DN3815_c0_g1_i3.p2  ORF type:complete len:173 (-),score=30.80 TRINITY_DN3815_c0_g1_i3:964-1482(-)